MNKNLFQRVALVCGLLAVQGTYGNTWAETGASPEARAKIQQFMAGDSVFIENAGQWQDTSIKFALDSRGANVGLTDRGPRFQLFRTKPGLTPADLSDPSDRSDPSDQTTPPPPSEMHEFALVFDGAAAVAPMGRGQSDRKFNYLVGDAANHREGVGSFNAVWYENLYPDISLEMTGRRSGVKYNFHIAPGADWRVIRLRYEGIDGLALKEDGTLEINIAEGWPPLSDGTPYIYQEVNGEKRAIAGRFTLLDSHTYGFEVTGSYDPTLPLVIDPEVEWGTYLGALSYEYGYGIAVHTDGSCYATGYTYSSGWVSGGWDTSYSGGYEGYVVKFNIAGGHEWSTYLGGTEVDYGQNIKVDSSGACYITGYTSSSGFVSGGWNTSYNGGSDGYVVKLNSSGGHVWSTYVGGTDDDYGQGIALDSAGACYITGYTSSTGWVSGGWDTSNNGGSDGYVVKLNSSGTHEWSTYLGGTDNDQGWGITVDNNDMCYITGNTRSSGWVSGGYDTTYNGLGDGYVVKLNSIGEHLWSTYVGGTDGDAGNGIVAYNTACYVTGYTNSSGWTSGGWDSIYGGAKDGFNVKINSAGIYEWSTYIGAGGEDCGLGIVVDVNNNCYSVGYTRSDGWTSGGWDIVLNGDYDGYLVKLNATGAYQWSTYLGGTNDDYCRGIAIDATNTNLWVTGDTKSPNWMFNGWDTVLSSNNDAYVLKIAEINSVGNLQVTLSPPEAIVAGAKWRRYPTSAWHDSGDTETGVSAGTWKIEFKYINNWIAPPSHTVTLSAGVTTTNTGVYTAFYGGVEWSTYLGGTGTDSGNGIVFDSNNNFYVVGTTSSDGWISGGWDTTLNSTDAYVMKLSNDGIPVWSSYIGGTGSEYGNGIALDSNNACYIVGNTNSSGWVSGGWMTTYAGGTDAYVVKLNSSGGYEWSSYLGGTSSDYGNGIAVDANGACFAVGTTKSSGWVDGDPSGTLTYEYGYVVKLNSIGEHIWSKYSSGGLGADYAYAVAVNSEGDCYVAGSHVWYNYHNYIFYRYGIVSIIGSNGTALGGVVPLALYVYGVTVDNNDIFYAVLDSGEVYKSGSTGWRKSIIGANYGKGIAVDSQSNCYITGYTNTSGWVNGGWDTSYNGGDDGFVLKLNSAGEHLWSSYLGNTGDDYGYGIAVDSTGATIGITGSTNSSGWISGGWQTTYSGNTDAFVAKIVDISIEGEGEHVIEGEGEVLNEGEGEPSVEGEGEIPAEGEGEVPVEGEGETPIEGEGEVEAKTILLPGDVPLELVWIPEGSFLMGRYPGEEGSYDREDPRHEVTLADGFWMGKYEVTQEQWLAVRGAWPDSTHVPSNSYGVGATYPAYYISWDDTQEFLTSLNAHIADTGQGPLMVRLPSEAEWEYACRAGTQTRFYFGDSLGCAGDCSDCAAGVLPGNRTDYMWYCGNNSIVGAKPVGGKRPNAFGLFDMSGNLNEWCEDDWHSTYDGAPVDGSAWVWTPRSSNRVRRGGAWSYETVGCRSALRNVNPSSTRGYHIGFRLAAVTPKPIEEDPYDCPSNGTIAGQPAIPPDQIADQTYYLSDEALWAPGMPLPADNFRAGGEVCGFRWWGVEVDGQGLPCERELTTFVVQVGSDALGWFWEDLVTAEKEAVTEVSFWNEPLNTDVLLTLYKYDVDTVTSCCSLDAEAVDHFVSIRSIFLNGHGETEDEGCYFGWTNSLDGDNTLWAGDFDGTSPYPLPGSDDNLTFCLTGGYPEGEGEGETPVPHPADLNLDYRMVIGEAIAYLAGWQQGANPIAYAIRAAYLWQNGEDYVYDAAQEPPLCWMLPESAEGEEAGEGEGEN